MPKVNSIIYPLITAGLVIIGCLAIRLMFQSKSPINISPKKKLSGKYIEWVAFPFALAMLGVASFVFYHICTMTSKDLSEMKPLFVIMGFWIFFQLLVAILKRPKKINVSTKEDSVNYLKSKYTPVVMVPVYNEDKYSLKELFESLFEQVILPKEIHVVDDGSKEKYDEIQEWVKTKADELGIYVSWTRQKNQGKREAHAQAFKKIKTSGENTIILTVDSDGYLDKEAIKEGLIPFEDPEVYSVAGVMNAKNSQYNLLSRITDLIFLRNQLIDRATMSAFGDVLVNSGALAFYRYEVVHFSIKKADYTNEKFFGSKVSFSDDSFLTFIAKRFGKTVMQSTAIVFSDMPTSFSHHVRQQLRWARGQFIRSWWRLKYLDILTYGWMRQLIGKILFYVSMVIKIQLLVIMPIMTGRILIVEFLLIMIFLSYVQSIRYFSIKRNDMTNSSRFLTYLISPIAEVWFATVVRVVTIYAYITARKTDWGTRKEVEIVHKD